MRALLIKTSSMGDVIHAMPALTDAVRAVPGLRFDWLVEEAFAPLCAAQPAVDAVVTVGLRRWRRRGLAALPGLLKSRRALRAGLRPRYDLVLDAQGLYKSAALGLVANGPRHGFDRQSAREPLASLLYRHRHRVAKGEHAVLRQRRLFAAAFGYPLPEGPPDYGLDPAAFPDAGPPAGYIVLVHGTSWANKLWPVAHWQVLAALAERDGLRICLPGEGAAEAARADAIAASVRNAIRLPPLDLAGIAGVLARASGVVAVDTGLGHLAAAFGVPCISLYGPTATRLTGTVGSGQSHLAATLDCAPCLRRTCRLLADQGEPAPCMASLDPEQVWTRLRSLSVGAPGRAAAG